MAYYNGSANSFNDLLTALASACVAEGWTWADGILSKGSAFVKLYTNSDGILIQGGTGKTGTTLDGASPHTPRLGRIHASLGAQPAWPMAYSIHLGSTPDEVYLIARHNVDYFYWLAFGLSDVPGLLGTGLWLGAVATLSPESYLSGGAGGVYIDADGSGTDSWQNGLCSSAALFWKTNNIAPSKSQNTVHCLLDGVAWADTPTTSGSAAVGKLQAVVCASPQLTRSPNTWNSEAILIPIQAYLTRASAKMSLVVDVKHARYVRVDNYTPEQIITLGPDKWKVYPFYRKNVANRNGQSGGAMIDHTGTFGWAIRYDGP
ncbi:MAG TPA: hypothetical protein PK873_14185 [Pseudomonas sp.]|uniref:hypothetical protein n=1 Tax=Pseudomonas sp. TaxID=306 RepID=UPI002C2D3772|nr:hypothetical protein [Pseudomonas sp.]HRL94697.1 hypothetical protein [Pseudomonas sp.]